MVKYSNTIRAAVFGRLTEQLTESGPITELLKGRTFRKTHVLLDIPQLYQIKERQSSFKIQSKLRVKCQHCNEQLKHYLKLRSQ